MGLVCSWDGCHVKRNRVIYSCFVSVLKCRRLPGAWRVAGNATCGCERAVKEQGGKENINIDPVGRLKMKAECSSETFTPT